MLGCRMIRNIKNDAAVTHSSLFSGFWIAHYGSHLRSKSQAFSFGPRLAYYLPCISGRPNLFMFFSYLFVLRTGFCMAPCAAYLSFVWE